MYSFIIQIIKKKEKKIKCDDWIVDIIEKGCTMTVINKYYNSEFHCLKFVFVHQNLSLLYSRLISIFLLSYTRLYLNLYWQHEKNGSTEGKHGVWNSLFYKNLFM